MTSSASNLLGHLRSRPGAVTTCILVGLVFSGLFVFMPAVHCGFIELDDPGYITQNLRVLPGLSWNNCAWAFTTFYMGFWMPLTWLSYMVDVTLFGAGAAGFHFTNVCLHAVNGALVFWWLWKATGARWRSAFVAAIFLLHPLRVESVVWITERKDVLSTFLGLLALCLYTLYARVAKPAEKSRLVYYGLSLLTFAASLMSKPMLVSLPLLLLLLDAWPLQRISSANWMARCVEKLPYAGLAALSSVITILAQKQMGALVPLAHLSLFQRLANALDAYATYLGKIFWPAHLALPYPHAVQSSASAVAVGAILVIGLSAAGFLVRRRVPYLLTGWFWFLITLVPVIGIVQSGTQALADRFTYLPIVGIAIILSWAAQSFYEKWSVPPFLRASSAMVILLACALASRRQLAFWRNSETLFNHTLAVTQANDIAHNCLGNYLFTQGRNTEAMDHFRAALLINPGSADALNNLAYSLAQSGDVTQAVSFYAKAAALEPRSIPVRLNWAASLETLGRTDDAIEQYRAILELDPNHARAANNLGFALAARGRTADAIAYYQKAIAVEPAPEFRLNLGVALAALGRTTEAIQQFQAAVATDPGYAEARNNLGSLLLGQGSNAEASVQFQAAVTLKPDYAAAHNNLGYAFFRENKVDEAIPEFQRALDLQTNYFRARFNLGAAFASIGRRDDAIQQFKQALAINPGSLEARRRLQELTNSPSQ